jgi:hypothetical protein
MQYKVKSELVRERERKRIKQREENLDRDKHNFGGKKEYGNS